MWQCVSFSWKTCSIQHMLLLTNTQQKTIETRSDPEKRRLPLIKPFIFGLTSMMGDIVPACFPALFLSVFAHKQGLCVLWTRMKTVCSGASRSWLFWKKNSALSTTVVSRAMRYDALSSSLQSPPPLWEEQPPSEWGQARVCQTLC